MLILRDDVMLLVHLLVTIVLDALQIAWFTSPGCVVLNPDVVKGESKSHHGGTVTHEIPEAVPHEVLTFLHSFHAQGWLILAHHSFAASHSWWIISSSS